MTRNGIKVKNSALSGAITPKDRILDQQPTVTIRTNQPRDGYGFSFYGSKSNIAASMIFGAVMEAREKMRTLELLRAQGLFKETEHGEKYRELTNLLARFDRPIVETTLMGLGSPLPENVTSGEVFVADSRTFRLLPERHPVKVGPHYYCHATVENVHPMFTYSLEIDQSWSIHPRSHVAVSWDDTNWRYVCIQLDALDSSTLVFTLPGKVVCDLDGQYVVSPLDSENQPKLCLRRFEEIEEVHITPPSLECAVIERLAPDSGYLGKLRVKSANNTFLGAHPNLHSFVIADSLALFDVEADPIGKLQKIIDDKYPGQFTVNQEAEPPYEENALGQDYKTKDKLAKVTAAMKQKQRTKADLLSRNPFFNRQK
jgi:hypothetical protein